MLKPTDLFTACVMLPVTQAGIMREESVCTLAIRAKYEPRLTDSRAPFGQDFSSSCRRIAVSTRPERELAEGDKIRLLPNIAMIAET